MSADVAYLDTSAFVKLVLDEPESGALRAFIGSWPTRVSSVVMRTESLSAIGRSGQPALVGAAMRLMRDVSFVALTPQLADVAGEIPPLSLRSLDAVHIASALQLGSALGSFVTYDERLASAARDRGLPTASPS